MEPLMIRKADGSIEPFDEGKLRTSLENIGLRRPHIEELTRGVREILTEYPTTDEVYSYVSSLLKKRYLKGALKYSLKKALFALGPTGFPFENYMAELFRKEGWNAEVGVFLKGKCAEHEVDVLLKRGSDTVAVEAKFHSSGRFKTDLKTVLYIHSRFNDLEKCSRIQKSMGVRSAKRGMLVTNTQFTKRALEYAQCAGVPLMGWKVPRGNSLRDLIEKNNVHPITCLPSLKPSDLKKLFSNNIVLCQDMLQESTHLKKIGVHPEIISTALRESKLLCV